MNQPIMTAAQILNAVEIWSSDRWIMLREIGACVDGRLDGLLIPCSLDAMTADKQSGCWTDNRNRGHLGMPAIQRRQSKGKQIGLSMSVSDTSGMLNPSWVEWLMGWPIGWTDLKPLEMGKFRAWLNSHGKR